MNENKFNGMGKIYSKYRPSYPFNFVNYLFTDVGISQNSIIADIGSGTGILTGQLLEKGSKVYGVEPNADMRVIAETNLKDLPRFTSVNGCAENTTIDDNSVDYITVAQAFHWFDRERFKKECQRILKPEGKVILVWNVRDNKNELVMENYKVNRKYCPSFNGFSDGMYGKNNEDDFSDFFNGKYETKVFLNNLIFDMDGFIGRNLSSSYALKSNDEQYDNYVNELKKVYEKYSSNGQLIMPNLTCSYIGNV
ncbi:MAG: class I SAM-dependent methyltransferase [Clostridium sp.]|nr:class I SAM-dependent methyltransferase [Clostridium sp.]